MPRWGVIRRCLISECSGRPVDNPHQFRNPSNSENPTYSRVRRRDKGRWPKSQHTSIPREEDQLGYKRRVKVCHLR